MILNSKFIQSGAAVERDAAAPKFHERITHCGYVTRYPLREELVNGAALPFCVIAQRAEQRFPFRETEGRKAVAYFASRKSVHVRLLD